MPTCLGPLQPWHNRTFSASTFFLAFKNDAWSRRFLMCLNAINALDIFATHGNRRFGISCDFSRAHFRIVESLGFPLEFNHGVAGLLATKSSRVLSLCLQKPTVLIQRRYTSILRHWWILNWSQFLSNRHFAFTTKVFAGRSKGLSTRPSRAGQF